MFVVRIKQNHTFAVLSRQKQQVRLGEGEFDDEEIRPEAMDRAVMVCRKFSELAKTFEAQEFVAVATSATREAANQVEFLNRLRKEASLDVRVISGREEARLIYMGVTSGTHLAGRNAIFIDIGGGSTEIALGDNRQYFLLDSLRLGAIRLTNQYFPDGASAPVSPEQYRRILQHVRDATIRIIKKIRLNRYDCAIGSSGTIQNLADIAARAIPRTDPAEEGTLTQKDLKRVVELLRSLPLEQRKKLPGINPERADIIIAGAAILEVLVKELGLQKITVTGRGLQDGLLVDYLSRIDDFPLMGELSVRERSVIQLGRSCGINEAHARTVTGLVLDLFDSAGEMRLHSFGSSERELLEYAAFLHDIGTFISYTNHHAHSWYIITNSDLLGFDQREIAMIANIARFHRKKTPRKSAPGIADLDTVEQEKIRILSTFLRLAESLDRSHAALIRGARFRREGKGTIRLEVAARGDCQLEIWGVGSEKKAFGKVFGKILVLEVVCQDDGKGGTGTAHQAAPE
jgi:exopolyphosphatase/guanosine-5'-triphosphate,3'-diphosphate pyrophosphatase